MSGQVFIEEHDIAESLGLPTGAKHLYLVYRENGTGAEYVLRSGPMGVQFFGAKMDIEINVPMAQSEDDRDGDTPQDRSSTPLDFRGLTDDQAWSMMVKYARGIDAAGTTYDALDENSNTFVAALLHGAHGTPSQMLPDGITFAEVPGYLDWGDLVGEVTPPADWIFRGTNADDSRVGLQMDEVFQLAGGNDVLRAGRGNDFAQGGAGRDTMNGDAGNDRLFGQSGADILRGGTGHDRLSGGVGADILSGGPGGDILSGGPGNDLLVGGSGADVFDFAAGEGRDAVRDFQDGSDRLEIRDATVQAFADLAISQAGTDLRVAFDGSAVILHDVALADFDATDVILLPPDNLMA